MKIILRIVLICSLGFIAYGYYNNYNEQGSGEKFIGIGVMVFAFLLLPLFIYHRYKDKDLTSYSFKDFTKKPDE